MKKGLLTLLLSLSYLFAYLQPNTITITAGSSGGNNIDSLRKNGNYVEGLKSGLWIAQYVRDNMDSIRVSNDSVFIRIAGVWRYQYKNPVYSTTNGLTRIGNIFKLGGTISENTFLTSINSVIQISSGNAAFEVGQSSVGGYYISRNFSLNSQQIFSMDSVQGVRLTIMKDNPGVTYYPHMGINIGMDTAVGIAVIGRDLDLGIGEQVLYYLPKYRPKFGQTRLKIDTLTRQSYWDVESGGSTNGADSFRIHLDSFQLRINGEWITQGPLLKDTLYGDESVILTGDSIKVHKTNVRGYYMYKAKITQGGTAAPVATVLMNTFPEDMVWERDAEGLYAVPINTGLYTDPNKFEISITNPITYNLGANSRYIAITGYDFAKDAFMLATYQQETNFGGSVDTPVLKDNVLGNSDNIGGLNNYTATVEHIVTILYYLN